jgi:hypothetical protein
MDVLKENAKKLETHALEGIFVGYDGHSKACRFIVFNIEKSSSLEM